MARKADDTGEASSRPGAADVQTRPTTGRKPKTSAAAVFALVFGLAALFCALAVLLAPLAIVFGLIGLILGIVGIGKAKEWHVTGKGVAIGGLVLAVLGLLLGLAILVGAATFLTDEQNLQRIESRLQNLRGEVPTALPNP